MKRKITIFAFAVLASTIVRAQVFTENFTSTWNPVTQGWAVLNLSAPIGTTSVLQGNSNPIFGSVFPAYNGGTDDYVSMDWTNCTTTAAGGISTWLMTPALNISNGSVLKFATRTIVGSPFPDRLQVRMSPANSTVIPTGTTSIGTYTALLLDINPNLTLNTSSVVSNGTVNGYPDDWAVYSLTVSGVTGTVSGRFAFRYFVDDGGGQGANSNYIGIDAVKFTPPCSATIDNFTICANGSATLSVTGGINPNSYTWSPGGSNNSTLVVTPAATSIYTVNYKDGNTTCPSITGTVTIGNQLSISASASSNILCSGNTTTLSATGPATSYSWSNGSSGQSVVVSPSVTTTYTVIGTAGTSPNVCSGSSTVLINILPSPTIGMTFSPTTICCNATIDIVFTGATTFTSYLNTFAPLVGNPISLFTDATDSNTTFTLMVQGTGTNGCVGSSTTIQYVQPLPTLSIASPTAACVGSAITLTASGAATYTWSGPGSVAGSANPATFNTPITPGLMTIIAKGTTSLGCEGITTKVITVSDCVGLNANSLGINEVAVFPNPFNQELKVNGFNGRIEIYNSIGQLMISMSIGNGESINTSEFNKGAYILKLLNPEGEVQATTKLIKN